MQDDKQSNVLLSHEMMGTPESEPTLIQITNLFTNNSLFLLEVNMFNLST